MIDNKNNLRPLQEVIDDFDMIFSNKLSLEQARNMTIGLVFELVQRRDIFKKNEDLRGFIDATIIPFSIEKESFKDYLFNSRTLIGSRISKILLIEFEYSDLIKVAEMIIAAYKDQKLKSKKSNSNIDDEIIKWMNFLGDDE